jgi:polyvinyl alcohol dehydrogenase (cytochrome)
VSRGGRFLLLAVAVLCGNALSSAQTPSADGRALFETNCASCHNGAEGSRAPSLESLHDRTPEAVVTALTGGTMRIQGAHMSGAERRGVAEFVTAKKFRSDATGSGMGRCAGSSPLGDPFRAPGWNGWSPTKENTHFQPSNMAGLTAAQVPALKLKWALGFPDAAVAWGQPTVMGGRLYEGSQNGTVYALNAATGCILWTFSAAGSVRTAITIGPRKGPGRAGYNAYFADMRGNVYAVDAADGKLIWSRNVENHPMVRMTGTPALYEGILYVPAASFE